MTLQPSAGASCVECQRRKQKCNREFPCNHCLKRGVSHLCRSKTVLSKASREARSQDGQASRPRKRSLDSSDAGAASDGDLDQDDSGSEVDVSGALNGLGYMSHHHHLVLGQGPGPKAMRDTAEDSDDEQSEELIAALSLMPEKRYTGTLGNLFHLNLAAGADSMQTVLSTTSSLILRVCACSLHFIIENNVKVRLEKELETDVLTFANRLHSAAEKLSASIAPGKGGLVHVQQLFLTAYWFKSAEKWTEAWHALSKAIRAANEIGLHHDSLSEGMSEFDREMRRRVWVILYLWDFALGSMLSRPLLVNHADCTIEMPTLTLENNPNCPDQPSPFRHMNLHCQLCINMAAELGGPSASELDKAEIAKKMRDAVEKWFEKLPAEYAVKDPDTRWDAEFEWVVFQRRYLHLIGYMGLFSQLRPFVARSSAKPMSDLESTLRASGVDAALGLMDVSWSLFENLVSVGAKFHYAIFCIFDAATVMCSAFVQDEARNLPRRETILEAIKKALSMLAEVAPESKTTAALYRILKGLLSKLPLSAREQGVFKAKATKRVKSDRMALPNHRPTNKSPDKSSSKQGDAETRRARRPRHRSSSASSNSDSTLDSSNCQPRSESSVSLPDSCRSISAQASSGEQARPPSIVPSNGAASVGGVSTPFVAPAPIHPAYPSPTDHFMPATTVTSTAVFMASDGFPPAHGFAQSSSFQYNSTLSPVDAIPFSQAGWQPSQVPMNGLNGEVHIYQPGSLAGFDNTAPSVLGYWEWQTLGLGHPVSWGQQVQDQNGMRYRHNGFSGGFHDRGMANDGESSSTDGLSR